MSKMRILCHNQFFFVIVCLSCIVCVTSQSYAGESCYHQNNRANGVCRQVHLCEAARDDLKKGIYPQQCGFEGSTILVCCVEKATTTARTTTTSATTTRRPNRPLSVGDKSKRACKTYEKLAYKLEYSPAGIADGPEEVENCPWEPDALIVISGGQNASKGEFPHMAIIGYGTWPSDYAWKCGGSLISEKFVLTAAHCLNGKRLGEPKFVRLGDTNYAKSNDDADVQQINIKQIHRHPDHKFAFNYHDIALLELEKPANLNVYVKPICLYTEPTTEPVGLISGWGNTEFGVPSENLLKAVVGTFGLEQCQKTYADSRRTLPRGVDDNVQICYGSTKNNKDTCPGDSGGPIQIYAEGVYCSYYMFGVTSFGKGCGYRNVPGVYVRVSSYIEWIESIVWP